MRIVPLLSQGLDLGGTVAAQVGLVTPGGWDTRTVLAAFMGIERRAQNRAWMLTAVGHGRGARSKQQRQEQ